MRWTAILVMLLSALILLPVKTSGAVSENFERKPSAELLGRAASYIEADTLLDKAVAALSAVANRYYARPEGSTARQA